MIKTWAFRFVSLCLACCAILGFEYILRLAKPDLVTSIERFRMNTEQNDARRFSVLKKQDPDLLWILKPYSSLSEREALNSHGFRGPDFSIEKPPDTYRILILGDSRSFGFGLMNYDDIYPARMQQYFNQTLSNTQVEILNLSVIGYSSYQGKILLEKYGKLLQPDLVIIWFGFNDLLYYFVSDQIAASQPHIQKTLSKFLNHIYIYQWLSQIWNKFLNPTIRNMEFEQPIIERVPPVNYEQNLFEMIHNIQKIGAQAFVLSTPVREAPPLVLNSLIRKTKTDSGKTLISSIIQYEIDGYWLMDKWEFPGTESELDVLLKNNPDIAVLHYFKALKLIEKGETEAAQSAFDESKKLDYTKRVVTVYNEIAQKVTNEANGDFVDLVSIFKEYRDYPLFLDDCHPNHNGHNLIASRILETITGIPSRQQDSYDMVSMD